MSSTKGVSAQFFRHTLGDFRHPLKITLPPPGRNPENAPDNQYNFSHDLFFRDKQSFCLRFGSVEDS